MLRIVIDAMGGDNGAGPIVRGVVAALKERRFHAIIVGDEREILEHLRALKIDKGAVASSENTANAVAAANLAAENPAGVDSGGARRAVGNLANPSVANPSAANFAAANLGGANPANPAAEPKNAAQNAVCGGAQNAGFSPPASKDSGQGAGANLEPNPGSAFGANLGASFGRNFEASASLGTAGQDCQNTAGFGVLSSVESAATPNANLSASATENLALNLGSAANPAAAYATAAATNLAGAANPSVAKCAAPTTSKANLAANPSPADFPAATSAAPTAVHSSHATANPANLAPQANPAGVDLSGAAPAHPAASQPPKTAPQTSANQDPANLADFIEILHCSDYIRMEDAATNALKRRESSIYRAIELVREGRGDVVISAGHSGASMSLATMRFGRIEGVSRPAICTTMPRIDGKPSVILDAGANVDCRAEHLVEFAQMGFEYAKSVLGYEAPRVGLLSNGEEDNKGNELTKEVFKTLKNFPFFKGNVEGNDIFNASVDVIVCDGFSGNLVLKASEGVAWAISEIIKSEVKKSFLAKLGALLMMGSLKALKKRTNYEEYGGAPLLGVNKNIIICHGKSSPRAIECAIYQGISAVESRVIEKIASHFSRENGGNFGGKNGGESVGKNG